MCRRGREEVDFQGIRNSFYCMGVAGTFLQGNVGSLETGKVGSVEDGNNSVALLLSLLILVAVTLKSDANTLGDVADTLGPQESVQGNIDANIRCTHLLRGKALDSADGARSTLLEGTNERREIQ
jgi:3-deoxy-D-manno-octulosonate 8-phosphate phosphatase KdsC-like HAD superfamily phosphatase